MSSIGIHSTIPGEAKPKRKRRWLRFSLRTFFVVLTAGCLLLGYWAYHAEQQRDAVRWVRANGGDVSYRVHAPQWLCDVVGIDYCATVSYVKLNDCAANRIDPLANLTSLEAVNLEGTPVSDLTPLAGLSRLRRLDLTGTKVTDLNSLRQLPKLGSLTLDNTAVVDLEPLRGTGLIYLSVANCPISNIDPLCDVRELDHLYLDNTNVVDITPLLDLPRLHVVGLKNVGVPDSQKDQVRTLSPNCSMRE